MINACDPVVGSIHLQRDPVNDRLIHVYPGTETRESLEAVNGYLSWLARNYPDHTPRVHWNEVMSPALQKMYLERYAAAKHVRNPE